MSRPQRIASRDNPRLVRVRRLLRDGFAYRKGGRVWLEGEHLLRACVQRGVVLHELLIAESAWSRPDLAELASGALQVSVLSDALYGGLGALASPAGIGALIEPPPARALSAAHDTVVLDRLQDAGNVGSILRSAAALGVRQVAALKGTAALWSPKVLRAGMGAHFALQLHEGLEHAELSALRMAWVGTSSHATEALHRSRLPAPCAWIFGHEGQGIDPSLATRCDLLLRVEQPGGEESLNVAAAAAICLYESARQRG